MGLNFGTILGSGLAGLASGGPVGGLVGLGTGIIGSMAQDIKDKKAQARADQVAMQQRQWQLEDRQHLEYYQSPHNQMQLLRSAGINPLFSAGQIQAGQSAMPSDVPYNVPEYSDPMAAISSSQQSILSGEQLKIDRANVEVAQAQNILKSRELDQQKELNDQKIKESDANIDLLAAMRDKSKEEQNVAFYTAQLMRQDVVNYEDKLRAELDLKKAEISYKDALTLTDNKLRDSRKRNLDAQTADLKEHVELMKKQGKLTDQQVSAVYYAWNQLKEQLDYNVPFLQAQLLSGQINGQYYANRVAQLYADNCKQFIGYELEKAKLDTNHLGYFVRNVFAPLVSSFALGYGAMRLGVPAAPTGYVQGQGYQYGADGKLQSIETYRNYR